MPILGQIWSFWGKKSFFFTWEIKSFVTHITENSPRHLVHIVFGRSLDKMCKKWQYLAQDDKNTDFGPNLGVFGPKILIFKGGNKTFGTHISGNLLDTCFVLKYWPARLQWDARDEKVQFWLQNFDILDQKSIFFVESRFFVKKAYHQYRKNRKTFHLNKFSVSEVGVIFWGSPLFLAVFGHSHVRRATTLNFGPISTKLGGIVRAIKKMTQKDKGPGPGRNCLRAG